jgi:hypothetical protein
MLPRTLEILQDALQLVVGDFVLQRGDESLCFFVVTRAEGD